jgi:hypothetical protein
MMLLGIDVGYSRNRPTCGVASDSERAIHECGGRVERISGPGGRSVTFAKYRIGQLERGLAELAGTGMLDGAVCVLDGPLGPGGPPRVHRFVDAACMRAPFAGRAVPASVCGGGRDLVAATYRIARAITGCDRGPAYRFGPRCDPGVVGPQVFETHPTIGLAIITEMAPVAEVPSRRVQAKSDFYWERGGGRRVEAVIGGPGVAAVRDHDHRAALYALAVAFQVAGVAVNRSLPIVIGKDGGSGPDAGVYVLVGPPHSSWEPAVRALRITA